MANELKDAIRNAGLVYKEVADKVGCSTTHVCADVSRGRVSVERAIRYGRALGVDPAIFRPDVLNIGEVTYGGDIK